MSKKDKATVTLAESDYLLIEALRRYYGLNTVKPAVRRCILQAYEDAKNHPYFKKVYNEVKEEIWKLEE